MNRLEEYRKHWADVVHRHAILMALQDNINNVDFNTQSYSETIYVASNIEFMALTLRRMYEHIATAIWHIYPSGKKPAYQASKTIKEIKKQRKKAETRRQYQTGGRQYTGSPKARCHKTRLGLLVNTDRPSKGW